MELSTKLSLIRYYAQRSTEELQQDKNAIGTHLRATKVKDLDDIKTCIAIINDELAVRVSTDTDDQL